MKPNIENTKESIAELEKVKQAILLSRIGKATNKSNSL